VLFNSGAVVLPIIRPLMAVLLGYLFIILYTIGVKEKDRRKVRNIFLKTVSPEIGEEILKQPDSEAIWGTKKRVTILFVDIRKFTWLSERLSADQIVQILNTYYDTASAVILKHGGQINKFMGDAVMALFGAPLSSDADEARAIQAAVEIQHSSGQFNALPLIRELNITLGIGIGINSGEVMVGTVGGAATRFEYTAIGDSVNIAERLQGIASDGQILVGEQTYRHAMRTQSSAFESQGISFVKLPEVKLKGKTTSVDVYEVQYS
jgi:adenylate cyclase